MELTAALTADMNDLCTSAATDPDTVLDPLRALNRDLRLISRSYLGLELILLAGGRAITVASFEPGVQVDDIASSLHLPLALLHPALETPAAAEVHGSADQESALIVYAGRPGALVDLAADLTYALAPGHPGEPRSKPAGGLGSAPRAVSLDQHLTPQSLTPGVTGTEDASTVNRAVGLLMGQGQTQAKAHRDLTSQAARAGVSVVAWSAQLLRAVG